eukprot:356518-Chlamydomonas_euryale.AAC.3
MRRIGGWGAWHGAWLTTWPRHLARGSLARGGALKSEDSHAAGVFECRRPCSCNTKATHKYEHKYECKCTCICACAHVCTCRRQPSTIAAASTGGIAVQTTGTDGQDDRSAWVHACMDACKSGSCSRGCGDKGKGA